MWRVLHLHPWVHVVENEVVCLILEVWGVCSIACVEVIGVVGGDDG